MYSAMTRSLSRAYQSQASSSGSVTDISTDRASMMAVRYGLQRAFERLFGDAGPLEERRVRLCVVAHAALDGEAHLEEFSDLIVAGADAVPFRLFREDEHLPGLRSGRLDVLPALASCVN